MEPDILVKQIKDDPGTEGHIKSENETSSDEEDTVLSGDEAFYTHTKLITRSKSLKMKLLVK